MHDMYFATPRQQAEEELAEENYRAAVERWKEILRARRWWHVLFPFKVIILRRDA